MVSAEQATYLGNLQGDSVPLPQFLQLSDDAVCDTGLALRIQAVHHSLHQINLHMAPSSLNLKRCSTIAPSNMSVAAPSDFPYLP